MSKKIYLFPGVEHDCVDVYEREEPVSADAQWFVDRLERTVAALNEKQKKIHEDRKSHRAVRGLMGLTKIGGTLAVVKIALDEDWHAAITDDDYRKFGHVYYSDPEMPLAGGQS